jgi:hypothetical protein
MNAPTFLAHLKQRTRFVPLFVQADPDYVDPFEIEHADRVTTGRRWFHASYLRSIPVEILVGVVMIEDRVRQCPQFRALSSGAVVAVEWCLHGCVGDEPKRGAYGRLTDKELEDAAEFWRTVRAGSREDDEINSLAETCYDETSAVIGRRLDEEQEAALNSLMQTPRGMWAALNGDRL